jgi:biopolymer transport protein TolQ
MAFLVAEAALGGRLASLDIFGLILQAGLIVQLVILLLAVFSVVSWAIIAFKWRELSAAAKDSEAFLEVYHQEGFEAAYEAARHLEQGPLAVVFLTTCSEMNRLVADAGRSSIAELDEGQMNTVNKCLIWTSSRESERLERGLSFLATTGSSAPFIGLFGTVIGIISAFQGIAAAGSASLAVVAPGIAEALIATAAGLLAAIPATIFYNVFIARIEALNSAIELFKEEFMGDLDRFTQRGVAGLPVAGGRGPALSS